MKIFDDDEKVCMTIILSLLKIMLGGCLVLLPAVAFKSFSHTDEKENPKESYAKPPNYDKKALLDLMEAGECIGGTIHDGKFSVFICKEEK